MIDIWKPERNPEDYVKKNVQGIELYVPKEMWEAGGEAVISLSTLLRWKKLTLDVIQ